MAKRKLSLVAGMEAGPTMQNHGMWLHPESDNRFLDPAGYEHQARVLEQGCFDALFFADTPGFSEAYQGSYATLLDRGGQIGLLDPVPIVAMMARVTSRIGLGLTLSSSLLNPYYLARLLATLDVLTAGRIAWNVVTTAGSIEARNFGLDGLPQRDERYDRADEVLEACDALWSGWDEDALIVDKASGVFADSTKIRPANYQGRWIRTRGPLTVPRGPQGRPVIMQAGASPRGRRFAARWAEMIFTLQHDKASMQDFYSDIKGRMAVCGRPPEACAILVSIDAIIGETDAIARERADFVNSLFHDDVAFALVASHTGVDVSTLPLDRPLLDLDTSQGSEGTLAVLLQATRAEGLTLRQAVRRYATSQLCPQLVGTPAHIADQIEDIFTAGGCDGFILNPTINPGTFEQFVRSVVPLLQARGLFRCGYRHRTLRDTILSGE